MTTERMTVKEIMSASSPSAKYLDNEIKALTRYSKIVLFVILLIDFISCLLIVPAIVEEEYDLDLILFGFTFETESKFLFFLWYFLISSVCVGIMVFIFLFFIKSLNIKKERLNTEYRNLLLTEKLLLSMHNTNTPFPEADKNNAQQEETAEIVEKVKINKNPVMQTRNLNKDYVVPVKIVKNDSGETICPVCKTKQPDDRFCCYKCQTPFVNGQPTIPYWCSNCGLPGPYGDNCPKCGANLKIINE